MLSGSKIDYAEQLQFLIFGSLGVSVDGFRSRVFDRHTVLDELVLHIGSPVLRNADLVHMDGNQIFIPFRQFSACCSGQIACKRVIIAVRVSGIDRNRTFDVSSQRIEFRYRVVYLEYFYVLRKQRTREFRIVSLIFVLEPVHIDFPDGSIRPDAPVQYIEKQFNGLSHFIVHHVSRERINFQSNAQRAWIRYGRYDQIITLKLIWFLLDGTVFIYPVYLTPECDLSFLDVLLLYGIRKIIRFAFSGCQTVYCRNVFVELSFVTHS